MSDFWQKIQLKKCAWKRGAVCETHEFSDSPWHLTAFFSAAESKTFLCLKNKVGPEWWEKKDRTFPKATQILGHVLSSLQPLLIGSLLPVPSML